MSKKSMKEEDLDNEIDTMDEDQAPTKGKSGHLPPEKLNRYANDISAMKSDMDEIRGEIGATMKSFEEEGGHKKELKLALALKNMETIKAQDFIRSFEQYCHDLGVYDQHDLFDPVQPSQINKEAAQPAVH